jgi:hypothetical protein
MSGKHSKGAGDASDGSIEFDMTAFEVLEEALAAAHVESTQTIEQSAADGFAIPLVSHRRAVPGGARGIGSAGARDTRGARGAHGAHGVGFATSDTAHVDDVLDQLLRAARNSSSQAETSATKAAAGLSETPEARAIAKALAAVEAPPGAQAPIVVKAPASLMLTVTGASAPAVVAPIRPMTSAPAIAAPTVEVPAITAPTIEVPAFAAPTVEVPALELPRPLRSNSSEDEELMAVMAAQVSPTNDARATTKPSIAWGPREVQGEAIPEPLGSFSAETVRRRYIWPIFICAAAVFIIVTGLLTYFNRSRLAEQTEYRNAIQHQGNAYLDESIALIQEADSVIVALDKATESQIAEEDIPRLEALLDKTSSVQESLDDAIDKALQAKETFLEDEERQLAQYAQDAASYRKQMLEMSDEIVRYDIAAMRSALALEYAWTLIIDADANMRSAVETVAEGGAGAVTESRDYNQEAVNKLDLANQALDKTVEAFSTVDVGALRAYLEAKKASAELALASDEAFLEGSYYTAYLRNEEFIEKDAEAVRLAAAIPGDLLSLVVTAYEQAIGTVHEEYVAMRSRATDVDVHLRAYLGVDVLQEAEAEQNNAAENEQ